MKIEGMHKTRSANRERRNGEKRGEGSGGVANGGCMGMKSIFKEFFTGGAFEKRAL